MSDKAIQVKRWLDLAEQDARSADHLTSLYPMPLEIICYHCQQALEKQLKGFLCDNDVEVPRIHDLMKINRLCQEIDSSFSEIMEVCANLTPYGTQVRYPHNVELLEEDMREAMRDLAKGIEFIGKKFTQTVE